MILRRLNDAPSLFRAGWILLIAASISRFVVRYVETDFARGFVEGVAIGLYIVAILCLIQGMRKKRVQVTSGK